MFLAMMRHQTRCTKTNSMTFSNQMNATDATKFDINCQLLASFLTAIESEINQPVSTFDQLCGLSRDLIGFKLFTLTSVDLNLGLATRIYSNMPKAYPKQGTKPVPENSWTNSVLKNGEIFVANSNAAIADVFFDHELIASLGCGSAINIPVKVAGKVIGTINCLHKAGHYSEDRVQNSRALALPGAAAFMLERIVSNEGQLNVK